MSEEAPQVSPETAVDPRSVGGFALSDATSAEVDAAEALMSPVADTLRALIGATIGSTAEPEVVATAHQHLREALDLLSTSQLDAPVGVHYNAEGRSWSWSNPVISPRNPIAPPLEVISGDDGTTYAEVTLGQQYEGPPGKVHGGIAALLLDQLMGTTASRMRRPAMTGTLTLRYLQAVPLGPIRLEGRVDRHEGFKTFVFATVSGPDGVCVEADGIFVMPRWARGLFPVPE